MAGLAGGSEWSDSSAMASLAPSDAGASDAMRSRAPSDAGASDAGYYSSSDQPAEAGPSMVARSVDASPRELAAKARAAAIGRSCFRTRGAVDTQQALQPAPSSTAGRRHLLHRAPGSWSSGGGRGNGTGSTRSRSPTGFMRGGGGSVGSPTSSLSVHDVLTASMEAVAGVAAINAARPTEENRAIRRRSMSRRLSRGIGRSASSHLPSTASIGGDSAATAAEAAAADALALGASPAAARAAAEAALEGKVLDEGEAADERQPTAVDRRHTVKGWMGEGESDVASREGMRPRLSPKSGEESSRRLASSEHQVRN